MKAADAELKANADAERARQARNTLDSLLEVERSLQGRTNQAARMKELGLDGARQASAAADAARAKSAADAAAARTKVDAAQAAWLACIQRCKTQATKARTITYSAIGAAGTAIAVGMTGGGGGSPAGPPPERIAPPPILPPIGSTPPPVPPPPPPANTPPPPAATADGAYRANTRVNFDPAGHAGVIRMPSQLTLTVTVNGNAIAISGPANSPWITVNGVIMPDGSVVATSTGSVVGISGVAASFNGRIDLSGSTARLTGEYALGTNGSLPQGQPIRYGVEGERP